MFNPLKEEQNYFKYCRKLQHHFQLFSYQYILGRVKCFVYIRYTRTRDKIKLKSRVNKNAIKANNWLRCSALLVLVQHEQMISELATLQKGKFSKFYNVILVYEL